MLLALIYTSLKILGSNSTDSVRIVFGISHSSIAIYLYGLYSL